MDKAEIKELTRLGPYLKSLWRNSLAAHSSYCQNSLRLGLRSLIPYCCHWKAFTAPRDHSHFFSHEPLHLQTSDNAESFWCFKYLLLHLLLPTSENHSAFKGCTYLGQSHPDNLPILRSLINKLNYIRKFPFAM